MSEIDDNASARPAAKPAKRTLLLRLFSLSILEALRLIIYCLIVGMGLMFAGETQRAADNGVASAAAMAIERGIQALIWIATNGWRPALYGAGVVLPLWVLWRVVTLPFRK